MKICLECQVEFQPTNNRQLACFNCKSTREVRIKRERRQQDPEVQKRARQRRFGDININLIYERDGNICAYCKDVDGPFHIDHMTPLSRGGLNTEDNLTVACVKCNLRKHTMTAEEFHKC